MSITLWKNNTSPSVSDTLRKQDASGTSLPFDLTGCTVSFQMRPVASPSAPLTTNALAVIVSELDGSVRYDWLAADTATAGDYRAWWSVTLASGAVEDTEEFDVEILDHTTTNRSYVTLDELKATLNASSVTFLDADAELALAAASRAIDEMTGRRFYPDNDAQQQRRFLPQNPGYCLIDDLCELTTLEAQDAAWTVDQDFYMEPVNAPADGRAWTAIRTVARPFIFTLAEVPSGWAGFDGRITVTGRWGWLQTPAPIREATAILATQLLRRAREAPFGVVAFGADGSPFRIGRTDPQLDALLKPYVRFLAI